MNHIRKKRFSTGLFNDKKMVLRLKKLLPHNKAKNEQLKN